MTPAPVFFVDRALGNRVFPDMLTEAGIAVERHADHFAPDAPDVDWIPAVAGQGWYALTQDKRILKNRAEREAVIASGLGFFYLTGANASMHEVALNFVISHGAVLRFLTRTERPFIASLQRGRGGHAGRVDRRWPKP